MNIFTAPLIELAKFISPAPPINGIVQPAGGKIDGSFLGLGTLICLLIILGGFYFILGGQQAEVELETPIGTLKTGAVGLALVLIGAALYLGIGKILIGKADGD